MLLAALPLPMHACWSWPAQDWTPHLDLSLPLPAASLAAPACLQWVQPRPCHYLNLPKEELAKMPAMGKYGLS